MNNLFSNEKVIDLTDVPASDSGAPQPALTASEGVLSLSYNTNEENHRVTVSFTKPRIHKYGFPNDEVLQSHPLYKKGLKPYAVGEVTHSSWITELKKASSVHPQYNPAAWDEARHFIFAFHDSTFECIAAGLAIEH